MTSKEVTVADKRLGKKGNILSFGYKLLSNIQRVLLGHHGK